MGRRACPVTEPRDWADRRDGRGVTTAGSGGHDGQAEGAGRLRLTQDILQTFEPSLTPLQRQVLTLLSIPDHAY